MKLFNKTLIREAAKAGLLLVIVAAVTLELTGLIQFYFSRKGIREEAARRAESELVATQNKIMDVVNQAEAAVRNSIWIASWCLERPDSLKSVARRIVTDNPVVMGSTVAVVPGYLKDRTLFSPYVCETGDSLSFLSLATQEYDYPSQSWFTKPIELGDGYWSEPYVDEGGGDVLMTTFSMPVADADGRIAAVLTADISLDWLTELVGNIKVYPNAFSVMLSRQGQLMVAPSEDLLHRNVDDVAIETGDTTLNGLTRAMRSGEHGTRAIKYNGIKSYVFFAPVERTGWSMSIVIPDSEIYGQIRQIGMVVALLQILGLAMLVLILYSVIKSIDRYQQVSEKKERMESELRIGHKIQMSMVPMVFPPFPERNDIDMSAAIVPAKEVGGDLYDFYIRDEKLYFCIGDVSGKGVGASLVMAVTRSLFRSVTVHEDKPEKIMSRINEGMVETNDDNMFVTMFLGVLDMKTGLLRYCNAGHNAPLALTDHIGELPVLPNLPLGVVSGMEFQGQEVQLYFDDALFLYTDGVTEAENSSHELFGEERLKDVLKERKSADGHLEAVKTAVREFVGDAPQSDDITVLFIHYMNDKLHRNDFRRLVLEPDVAEIPKLAGFIDSFAQDYRFSPETVQGLNLALEEAVTNVMMYAYPKDHRCHIIVQASMQDGVAVFTISDSGVPFDPTAAPDVDTTLDAEQRPVGGLGIFLVRQIMDTVAYRRENGKNILTLKKIIWNSK